MLELKADQLTDEVPFKGKMNGIRCVIVAKSDFILVDFTEYKKTVEIPYEVIRCIQQWNSMIMINSEKNGKMMAYMISSRSSKKLFECVTKKISCI